MMIEYSKYNIRELEELLEHKNRIIQEYELKTIHQDNLINELIKHSKIENKFIIPKDNFYVDDRIDKLKEYINNELVNIEQLIEEEYSSISYLVHIAKKEVYENILGKL